MEKDGIWQDEYVMHTFLCDANRKARLTSLCHCLQETAGHHAIAKMMTFVNHSSEADLERLEAERRAEQKRLAQ